MARDHTAVASAALDACLPGLQHDVSTLNDVACAKMWVDNKAIMVGAVERNCNALSYAGQSCKDDKQIVLAAVRQDWKVLRHAGPTCKDDRQIVLAALRQCWTSLEFAGPNLRDDKEIVLLAMQQHSDALRYAGPKCKDDKDIVLAAVQKHGDSLCYASAKCKEDEDIVLAAVQQLGDALRYAGPSSRDNKILVLAAVQQDRDALRFAGPNCKSDKDVVAAASTEMAMDHLHKPPGVPGGAPEGPPPPPGVPSIEKPLQVGLGSALYTEQDASLAELEHKQRIRDRMEYDAVYAQPPPIAKLGGHLLLCIVSDSPGSCAHLSCLPDGLGPIIGIEHFMRPLRDKRLQGLGRSGYFQPAVVVIGEALPGDWYSVVEHERLYFVRGSPLSLKDLNRAGYRQARTIAIARGHLGGHTGANKVADARVLLLTALLEENLSRGADIQVITDLTFDGSCAFLPKSKVPFTAPPVGPTISPPRAITDFAQIANMGDMNTADVDFKQTLAEEDYESLEPINYAYHHRYMTGQIFIASSMTAIVANTLYNPGLVTLIDALIQAPILLLPLPAQWERRSYADLCVWLLRRRNLLALGLYRSATASDACATGMPLDESIPTHHYMFTAPPAYKTLVVRTDRILCLAPDISK
jgi:hypothetical protein